MTKYVVTVNTPKGMLDVELTATNADLAGKRAWLTLVHNGYGDVDEVVVIAVTTQTEAVPA
jgi:hypothetical protein